MKSSLSALFFAIGLVGCITPVQVLLAQEDEGLPAVESRTTDLARDLSAPQSSDKPMLLLEEANDERPEVPAIPDTPAARLDYLQQQVQELQGKLEVQEHRFQELNKQILDNYQDLDARIKTLAISQQTGAAQAVTAPIAEPTVVAAPDADRAWYHKAYSLAQTKQYDASVEAFKGLISTYPKSTYVPTAYFWMGEIYIIQSKYDLAIESFNQIVIHYATSPKISEAAFKIGYIEYARGNNKLAIKQFNQVKVNYPGTAAAKQAEQYLRKFKAKK